MKTELDNDVETQELEDLILQLAVKCWTIRSI